MLENRAIFSILRRWEEIERVKIAAGDKIVLRQRGDVFDIRFNGWDLMSNQATKSEKVLAEIVCDQIAAKAPKLLIGALGMGFTFRAGCVGAVGADRCLSTDP